MSWRNIFSRFSNRGSNQFHSPFTSPSSSLDNYSFNEPQRAEISVANATSVHSSSSSSNNNNNNNATDPDGRIIHQGVLVRFSFLNNRNNTVPVRLTEADGSYISMYSFLCRVSEAAIALLYNYGGGVNPRAHYVERARSARAVVRAHFAVKIRWNLGDGLLGYTELPLLDAEETWDEVARLLVRPGESRQCVVVDLPVEKVDWLRQVVLRPRPEAVPMVDSELEAEIYGAAPPVSSEWVPMRC